MGNIKINGLVVEAETGSELSGCIEDVIKLAFERKTIVLLTYNNYEYRINPEELVSEISCTGVLKSKKEE